MDAVGAKFCFAPFHFYAFASLQTPNHSAETVELFDAWKCSFFACENKSTIEAISNILVVSAHFFFLEQIESKINQRIIRLSRYWNAWNTFIDENTMKTIRKAFPLDRIVYQTYRLLLWLLSMWYQTTHTHTTTNTRNYHRLIEANHLISIGITQLSDFS